MKKLLTTLIPLLFALGNIEIVSAVDVDSVRYCRSGVPVICNAKTQPEYTAWERHNVPKRHQKRTFIARYSSPPRGATRHLLFIADGQANGGAWELDFNGNADNSTVSGRPENFRKGFDRFTRRKNIPELNSNLPERFMRGDLAGLNRNNTFAAAAWDARFHYASSSDTLNRVANSYFDWLRGKFDYRRLDVIVLVGHSRGGALVTVLAKKFRGAYPDIPVMVYTLDTVPHRNRSVPAVSSTKLYSPFIEPVLLVPDAPAGYAYQFDFRRFYGRTDKLRATNILGGRKFISVDSSVRPMAQTSKLNGVEREEFDWDWFKQQWFNEDHEKFNNLWAADYVFDDIDNHIHRLIAERQRTRPPVARCGTVGPNYAIGSSATAVFTDNGSYSTNHAAIVDYKWRFYQIGGQFSHSAAGKGPHSFFIYVNGQNGSANAELTVTNSEGISAKASCSFTMLGGCDDPNAILCDAPIEENF